MFDVVVLLTLAFLVLYWLGAREAFEDTTGFAAGKGVILDIEAFTGATMRHVDGWRVATGPDPI